MPSTTKFNKYELGRRLGKQGPRRTVKTQAASCDKSTTGDINLLQANISGIQNRAEELLRMLNQHNIHIALIQETIPPKKRSQYQWLYPTPVSM